MTFANRLHKLQKLLSTLQCDALLIDDLINLFYMTGLNLSAGKLLVHKKGAHLIVDSRYFEVCQKSSPFPVLALEKHPLNKLLASEDFHFITSLGFESDKMSHKAFFALQKLAQDINQEEVRKGRPLQLLPLDNPLQPLRNIKDDKEIGFLKEAADLGSEGFDFVCTLLKEGITELEVAIALEIFWKERGGRNVAFDPIIAFGANSSMPHHRAGNQYLRAGDPVLIDIGVCLNHYHSDMTRMAFFGEPDARIKTIHAIVQQAQLLALDVCKPGVTAGEVDAVARTYIASQGFAENFNHGLGHGVGLEIHEFPVMKNVAPYKDVPLSPGMVLTIEPGIYLPGLGGVRIEDTILITETGHQSLTKRSTNPRICHV